MSEIHLEAPVHPKPINLKRKYEFSALANALNVYEGGITSDSTFSYSLKIRHLLEEEEDQEDLKLLHLNSIASDEVSPLLTMYKKNNTTLVTFFSVQMIDIPKPFSRAKSLYKTTATIPRLRFLNMITSHGRKAKIARAYASALSALTTRYMQNTKLSSNLKDWRFLYAAFVPLSHIHSDSSFNLLPLAAPIDTHFSDYQDQFNYSVRGYDLLQDELFTSLTSYLPVFSFYIKKVDKLKRRHSRGKSGKYSISWKYVPQYRRLLVVLRWLAKDVKSQKLKTLKIRLLKSLETFLFDRDSHLVPRLRRFVHFFVFQNHKKTLLKTLKSVS